MTRIKIAAVGDLLMKSEIIASAKQPNGYSFDAIFEDVKPYLKKHHLTIGNLETTFSGNKVLGVAGPRLKCKCPRERRNPVSGNPVFNCPDELAPALKRSGFHVFMTANNHCMDGGTTGLRRTITILDRNGLRHTGTYRTRKEAAIPLIIRVKGIKIGLLNYTKGTNAIPVPNPWLVDRMDKLKVKEDIRKMKQKTDFLIAYLHFGKEYDPIPGKKEKEWMKFMFDQGVNAVLGSHPHVLHSVKCSKIQDLGGQVRNRVAASSLGNFISTRLNKNPKTIRGMILSLTITKNQKGIADVTKVERIPTIVVSRKDTRREKFKIVPIQR